MQHRRIRMRAWSGAWLLALLLIWAPLSARAALHELWDVQAPLAGLQLGDFNGDGKTDVFRINGERWQYSSAGVGEWQNLASSNVPLGDLRFYDFDGDGKTDVFNVSGDQWRYSSGGASGWINLNTSTIPLADLRFGDFNGDNKADVFNIDSNQWRYSSGGTTAWINLATSSVPLADLRFGDFDGDGKTDVFNTTGSQWRYSPGGAGGWLSLASNSEALSSMRLGDFNGSGATDVFNVSGTQWRYSVNGAGPWLNLVTSTVSITDLRFGDFDGDGKTDVFNVFNGQWRYSSGGASSWINIGAPEEPTPTYTPTPTPTPTPTGTITPIPPLPENCNNILVNGDMENDSAWTFGKSPAPAQYTGEQKHGGLRSVRLGIPGGYADAASYSSIRQKVTIPSNVATAQLRWWHLYKSEEAATDGPSNVNDRQEALLLRANGDTLAILKRVRRNEDAWTQEAVDLTAYRGQTLYVYFNVYNDGQGGRTWMFIDDVMVDVCGVSGGGGGGSGATLPGSLAPNPKSMPWPKNPQNSGKGQSMPQPAPANNQPSMGQQRPGQPPMGEQGPNQQNPDPKRPTGDEMVSRYEEARVLEVIDGETILVLIDGVQFTVRYLGIDTPDLGQPLGMEATVKNVQLVASKQVILEKDATNADDDGRLLRYVFLEDGTFVNQELVKAGYATVELVQPDVKYGDALLQAEEEAESQGRGRWATASESQAASANTGTPTPPEIMIPASPDRAPTDQPTDEPLTEDKGPAASNGQDSTNGASPDSNGQSETDGGPSENGNEGDSGKTVPPDGSAEVSFNKPEATVPSNCTELVVNGDFEIRDEGWKLSGPPQPQFDSVVTVKQSSYALRVGSVDEPVAGVSAVEQNITLPSDATSIVLKFNYYPMYHGEIDVHGLQYAEVFYASSNQTAGRPLEVLSDQREWVFAQYDLTPLAGQDIRLFFAVNNGSVDGAVAMSVDNVSIWACGTPGALLASGQSGGSSATSATTGSPSSPGTAGANAAETAPVRLEPAQSDGQSVGLLTRIGTIAVLAGILVLIGFLAVATIGGIQATR